MSNPAIEPAATRATGGGRAFAPAVVEGGARLYRGDCFDWMRRRSDNSVHAVVTDPPYGLVEYSEREQRKLRAGRGGVWRLPPAFDGHRRSPVPRFTTLNAAANHVGYRSIGIEISGRFVAMAAEAIPLLQALRCPDTPVRLADE